MIFMVFGFGKKKKETEEKPVEMPIPEEEIGERMFPSDLEKFKLKGPFEEAIGKEPSAPLPRFQAAAKGARPEAAPEGDIEMVLARLDAIEARLKVVEEKLRRL